MYQTSPNWRYNYEGENWTHIISDLAIITNYQKEYIRDNNSF